LDIVCEHVDGGREDQVGCQPINANISATLVSSIPSPSVTYSTAALGERELVAITPTAPASLRDISSQSRQCAEPSAAPYWEVRDGWIGNSMTFNLWNSAINYTVYCSIWSLGAYGGTNELNGFGYNLFNCSSYDDTRSRYPQDGIYTEIYWGGMENTLIIYQRWYCDNGDGTA